jgi:trimeric autotransporter adhesin
MKTAVILLMTMFTLACGYGSNYNSKTMTTPAGASITISTLSPDSATPGAASFAMTINGSGFGTSSVVYFNAVAHSATYISGNQLMTTITASDVAGAGTFPVYVRSNGVNSNTMNFMVQ